MNRPTAAFFCTVALLYERDEDAAGLAYSLATSVGFHGFGRTRREAALRRVAPDLADALQAVGVDIIYVHTDRPLAEYRAVLGELVTANAWLDEHGSVPAVVAALARPTSWPTDGWRLAVWCVANRWRLDAADAIGIAVPRAVREALVVVGHHT